MKTVKQIILFYLAFTATILISELFMRTSYVTMVSSSDFYNDIGRGSRQDLDYVYFNEGFGIGRFNGFRYIGEAEPQVKPDNTVRFVLLGDSYVESFQVFEKYYFGNIIENILSKKHKDRRFEFLNFGRSGFDIADVYAYQKTFAEKFDPDFYLYIISNDDLVPKNPDPLLPKVLLENDSLTISMNYAESQIRSFKRSKFFIQNFSIAQMMNSCRKKAANAPMLPVFFEKFYFWFSPAKDAEAVKDNNMEFVLNPVTKKIFESFDPAKIIIVNSDYKKLPGIVTEICSSRQIPLIDLSELLNRSKESGNDLNYWKITAKRGHWNHEGHKIIGEYLAEKIDKLLFK